MNIVYRKGLTLGDYATIIIIAILLAYGVSWLLQMPEKPAQVQQEVEVPEEVIFALANLEGDVGSIVEQRKNYYDISEALRIGTATTQSLGKKGDFWLTELRRRVDVREAMEAWQELQTLADESLFRELTRQEICRIPRLRKLVEAQILSCYAKDEGLECTHGQVDNLVASISKEK